MQKRILFRVDAGESLGLGHFYRSYSLAVQLREKGYYVKFVHEDSLFWREQIDFDFPHSFLNESTSEDEMIKICLEEEFDILFIDSLKDFQPTLCAIKPRTKLVFYQNLSESRNLSDIYILPSIHQSKSFFDVFEKQKTRTFQGLEYSILNEKVASLQPICIDENESIKTVGIVSGGSDPKNVLLKIFQLLNFKEHFPIKFNFYFGENYMHKNDIPLKLPINVKFERFDSRLIRDNDVLISTFGVSTYEFMGLGMPILSIGHQKSNANASKVLAEKTGAIYNLGLINDVDSKKLRESIIYLSNQGKIRKVMSEKAKSLIDFKGIDRVVSIIENIKYEY